MYHEQYKVFAGNAFYAARTLHCYLLMDKHASKDNNAYKALNHSARFWMDYKYMALQTVIIFLGKIFDAQSGTHNLPTLLETAKTEIGHFSKNSLRQRKIRDAGNFDGLDEYINRAHELTAVDITEIENYASKAIALWDSKIKHLRHRIYAHNQMLTQEQRATLFGRVKYDEITEVLQILLNIAHVLEQAEINGRKPDLTYNFQEPIREAEEETGRLFEVLLGETK